MQSKTVLIRNQVVMLINQTIRNSMLKYLFFLLASVNLAACGQHQANSTKQNTKDMEYEVKKRWKIVSFEKVL